MSPKKGSILPPDFVLNEPTLDFKAMAVSPIVYRSAKSQGRLSSINTTQKVVKTVVTQPIKDI